MVKFYATKKTVAVGIRLLGALVRSRIDNKKKETGYFYRLYTHIIPYLHISNISNTYLPTYLYVDDITFPSRTKY